MKNVIEYFYNIIVIESTIKNNKLYFEYNDNKYVFEEINIDNIETILLTQKYNNFHRIIVNKFNNNYSKYLEKNYILLKIVINENKIINLNDLINISFNINLKPYQLNNELWNLKTSQMCNYINDKDKMPYREYYDYYIGLSDNAYNYLLNVDYLKCFFGFTCKRINYDYTLYDIYDPCNIVIGPVIKGISTYIKNCFFNKEELNINDLINYINYNDSILLISNLLFPTYFYDLFKEKKQETLEKYISKASNYEKYILNVINQIKKKYKNIPLITWINQL